MKYLIALLMLPFAMLFMLVVGSCLIIADAVISIAAAVISIADALTRNR